MSSDYLRDRVDGTHIKRFSLFVFPLIFIYAGKPGSNCTNEGHKQATGACSFLL